MNEQSTTMNRRDFLSRTVAGAGAGLVLGAPNLLQAASKGPDRINVALVGAGKQGLVLLETMKNIPGLYFQAVCEINTRALQQGAGRTRVYQKDRARAYADIDEMLSTEKGLDAVVVATPDFWHAPHTVKCLGAGLHVYCEKMMSNTIDGARTMVRAMEESGNLCQIGHQRRSNPRYRFTLEQLINGNRICGQIVNVNGQWNRAVRSSQDAAFAEKKKELDLDPAVLEKYGYENMHQYRNWRFYRDLSGGPISDLGAHQIDVFNWFLGGVPKSVFASGGNDYFTERQHFDNVMAIFEYDTPQGGVRAFYQVLTTTSSGGGYYETFMGTDATIRISEVASTCAIYREESAPRWEHYVERGYLRKKPAPRPVKTSANAIASYETPPPEAFDLPGDLRRILTKKDGLQPQPPHQPHLENFFAAIRGEAELNCDAKHAFESEAPIFWVNPSALNGELIEFTDQHLKI